MNKKANKEYDLSKIIIDKEVEKEKLYKKLEKEGVEITHYNNREYIDIEGVSKLYNLRDVKLITKKKQLDFNQDVRKAIKTTEYGSGKMPTRSTLYCIEDLETIKDKFFKDNDKKDFIAFNK